LNFGSFIPDEILYSTKTEFFLDFCCYDGLIATTGGGTVTRTMAIADELGT